MLLEFSTMTGREFELPEPLIRLIQSFLTQKEAAQTTLLSRSWLSAWLNRPNLVFDLFDFYSRMDFEVDLSEIFSNLPLEFNIDSLLDYAEETIRRYEMSNLNIQSFNLDNLESNCIYNGGRITNLILGALKLGATSLSIHFIDSCKYKLPNEMFASENLVSLDVCGVQIDMGPNPTVALSMLRLLRLEDVRIQSRDMLVRIISSCPLIEELELSCIKLAEGQGFSGDGRLVELHRLRSLVLDCTDSDTLFLNCLSLKFPSLEDLTLRMYIGEEAREDILISSPSIKHLVLNIKRGVWCGSLKIQRVKFDLPSICKLTFEGSGNCDWVNRPGSMVWEFDDDVHHHKCLIANAMDFLGVTLLRGLNVRISNLRQLMYNGLNDLKEARAQIFDKDAFTWRDVALLDDSAILEDNPFVAFQLIWQPKQKKLN